MCSGILARNSSRTRLGAMKAKYIESPSVPDCPLWPKRFWFARFSRRKWAKSHELFSIASKSGVFPYISLASYQNDYSE